MVGIGVLADDQIVAAVAFEWITAHNAWAHVAISPGANHLNRTHFRLPFIYAFKVCGVDRISGYVDESNVKALRFNRHLGFKPEARLTGAAHDGGDVIIQTMWKKDCRYVDQK